MLTTGTSGMTDTSPRIERLMRDKLMAFSGEERFIMGAQMSECAREMEKASLPPGLSEVEQRRQLFKRLYGEELRGHPIVHLIGGVEVVGYWFWSYASCDEGCPAP